MLKLYNTLTRKKEPFVPLKGKNVNMFVCGITPYDFPHLGHAKTYIQFDIIARYLRYSGYKLFYLQNVTDIDDRIIERSKQLNVSWKTLSRKFESIYHNDMKSLDVTSINKFARATDYIKQIESQVKRMIKEGYAYKTNDGYYFNTSKFKNYGKLSRRTTEEAEDAVTRIDESVQKKNKADFCLWKFSIQNEPAWKSSLNLGRPGWHLEDTAITEKHFGPQYDLHGGAVDLIFPHHEAEIAQMESISKKPLVKYWLHTGFLNIKGKKMSKSLGNFMTVREAIKNYSPKVIRYFFISSHYRSPIDFNPDSLEQAKNSLSRLNEFALRLKNSKQKDSLVLIEKTRQKFIEAMDDDFDTPKALSVLFEFMSQINKFGGSKKSYKFLLEINKILGIFDLKTEKIPSEINKLVEKREKARKAKNWKEADRLRDLIKSKGYTIEDMEKGYNLKKI
ncbi:cysteine--tRNA ligase [Candidatus Woesearchaeota archaeon]|nr:cysteine--tRNA ligase [Candidatus Woesearchaeota archaeon]